MQVTIRLFAILKDRAGTAEAMLDLPPDATVALAIQAVAERFPETATYLTRSAAALNRSYTSPEAALKDGDELALIPPVSGG